MYCLVTLPPPPPPNPHAHTYTHIYEAVTWLTQVPMLMHNPSGGNSVVSCHPNPPQPLPQSPHSPANSTLTFFSVFQLKVLILKLAAIDTLAASAIVVGEVTTLAHEVWDDAVEDGVFVAISLLTSTQCTEVFWTRYTSDIKLPSY